MKKIKILNGLPLSAIKLTTYQFPTGSWSSSWVRVSPISEEEAIKLIKSDEVESFIGHQATAKLLGVPFSREEAKILPGDDLLIVTLRRRPRGDEEVKLGDLLFFKVVIPSNQWDHEII